MKIFTLLRSRIGAISKSGALSVLLTAGAAGFMISNYMSDLPAAQEAQIRSLSQIMASGGELPREYSGIKVSAGKVQLASAEDIAAWEADAFDAGEAEVQALNSFNLPNIQGQVLSAGEDGLGMAANAAVALGADGKPMPGGTAVPNVTIPDQAGQGQAKSAKAETKTLSRANMAVAQGNNLSFNQGLGGSANGGANANRALTDAQRLKSGEVPAVLTGSMPTGTTLVNVPSMMKGAHSSSFQPGDVRVRTRGGIHSPEGNDLKAMAQEFNNAAKRRSSFDANAVHHRGATRGTHEVDEVAMTKSSGGRPNFEKIRKGFERRLNRGLGKLDTTVQEYESHSKRLRDQLFCLLTTTLIGMMTISALMQNPDPTPMTKFLAVAVGVFLFSLIGVYIADCAMFLKEYGAKKIEGAEFAGGAWAVGGLIGGIIMTGCVIAA